MFHEFYDGQTNHVLDPKLTNLDDNFAFAECFPTLFPYGVGPFAAPIRGRARRIGEWATTLHTRRFHNHPAFFKLLLWAIQQDEFLDNPFYDLKSKSTDEHSRAVCHGTKLIQTITGADGTNLRRRGEVEGMIRRCGQPDISCTIDPRNGDYSVKRVRDSHDPIHDSILDSFPPSLYGNAFLSESEASQHFEDFRAAFLKHIVGWKSGKDGLFGDAIAFIGRVESDGFNGFRYHALIWLDNDNRHYTSGCSGLDVMARGKLRSTSRIFGASTI
jgi:hypothetical protein